MSVTTLVPSRANASDGSRIAPRKSARAARYSRTRAVLLVERVVRRHEGEDAAGPQGVERFREEVVVEREPLAVVLELHVGKRRVPDDGVDAPLGEPRVAEVLDADVVVREEGPGDSARERIELDADEVHPLGGEPEEVPAPAPRFEHRRVLRHAQAFQGRRTSPGRPWARCRTH